MIITPITQNTNGVIPAQAGIQNFIVSFFLSNFFTREVFS